jgi:hypothetical protein
LIGQLAAINHTAAATAHKPRFSFATRPREQCMLLLITSQNRRRSWVMANCSSCDDLRHSKYRQCGYTHLSEAISSNKQGPFFIR